MIDPQNKVTSYSYDAVGNRQSVTYPNGNETNYTYDDLNRLIQLTTTNGATTLTDYQYTLDASGHRTQIVEANGRTSNYIYDDLYRLTEEGISDALNGNYSASYQYDKVGNRTQSTINGVQTLYTIDDNDRLTQQGGETFTYDDNGNTLTKTIDADMTVYSYTPKNELAQAEISTLGNTAITMYAYDIDGIRSQKVANGETINYLTDANRNYAQVVKETNTTTNDTVSYLYGDDLIKQSKAANDSYYLYDGLGSTRALTNSTGSITDTYNYESFGSVLNQTGTTPNNYLFTGEQFDTALGMTYLRARYYDQNIGRFTQQDTWMGDNQDPVTLHKYLYANSNPVNMIDPSGLFSLVSLNASLSINSVLNTISVGSSAYNLFQVASGEKEITAKDIGLAILFSGASGKAMKLFLGAKNFKKICGNSFDKNTTVWTKDGLINISDVKIGQLVLSFNEANGKYEYHEVVHLIAASDEYKMINLIIDGDVISSTDNHRFKLLGGDWVEARDIRKGDNIFTEAGNYIEVLKVTTSVVEAEVYNLTVNNLHSFFIGGKGLLVHNDNISCPIPPIKKGGPSGKLSIKKYLENNWSKGTFDATKKSIEYHVIKHGRGLTPVQYTQRALQSFSDGNGITASVKDLSGKAAVKVVSKFGTGLFTPKGKVIWFHPRL